MAEITVDEIVQKAMALGLLTTEQLQNVWTSFGSQNVERDRFLQTLLRLNYLTKYQADRLAAGETTGFYYGKYRVLYSVGAGTFARVFRAVHSETGEIAAVKVLRKRHSSDPEAVNLFEREAELGMQLRHPNIVSIRGYDQFQGAHYMVMEFIEGQTLRQYVDAQKKVEYKIATRIITDICSGLDYAFKRSHLHRDLKLTNVLLSSSGKALLLDFGLAADTDDKKDQKNQRAVDYAVLERSTCVRRDDPRSDIYFLGVIFYQMLSGVAPIGESKERAKRLNKDRFLTVKPLREVAPRVPAPLDFIVNKAMSLDPEKRYQSPAAMLTDLKLAVRKLEETGGTAPVSETKHSAERGNPLQSAQPSGEKPVVCIVESNIELQDSFRNSFKKAGYRVLVFSNVERVLERFSNTDTKVDCIIFNAQSLKQSAVIGFNALTQYESTKDVPAVLILDENQLKWAAKALRTKQRVAVGMPVTMKRLSRVVGKLVAEKNAENEEPGPASAEPAKAPKEPRSPSRILTSGKKAGMSKLSLGKKTVSEGAGKGAEPNSAGDGKNPESLPAKGDAKASLLPKTAIDTSHYDIAIEGSADSIAAHLEEILAEPQKSDSAPESSDDSAFMPYPDDDEFFFDYVCDRDL